MQTDFTPHSSGGCRGCRQQLRAELRRFRDLLDKAPVEPEEIADALAEKLSAQQDKAGEYIQLVFASTAELLLQTALLVIALYFMLVDGPRLVTWCEDASPLHEGQTLALLREFKGVSVSGLVSSIATGVIQS